MRIVACDAAHALVFIMRRDVVDVCQIVALVAQGITGRCVPGSSRRRFHVQILLQEKGKRGAMRAVRTRTFKCPGLIVVMAIDTVKLGSSR